METDGIIGLDVHWNNDIPIDIPIDDFYGILIVHWYSNEILQYDIPIGIPIDDIPLL